MLQTELTVTHLKSEVVKRAKQRQGLSHKRKQTTGVEDTQYSPWEQMSRKPKEREKNKDDAAVLIWLRLPIL